jgi:S1-C subfamily serine protease
MRSATASKRTARYLSHALVVALLGWNIGCDTEPELGSVESARRATVRIEVTGTFRLPEGELQAVGSGSGFVIDPEGYILTNNHVASGSATREVFFVDEPERGYHAQIVATSECSDLAVLKIDPDESLTALQWYEGDIVQGQEVYAAGFPDVTGASYRLSEGIVSTEPKEVHTEWASVSRAFYHAADINQGNSGGPLIDRETGHVLGVNYAGRAESNANVAIAADGARSVVKRLLAGEDVEAIGIDGSVKQYEADDGSLRPAGIWVSAVRPGGPADRAGIRPGDLLVNLANMSLTEPRNEKNYSMENYCELLRSNNPATSVLKFEIVRFDTDQRCAGEINAGGNPGKLQAIDEQGQPRGPCTVSDAVDPNDGGTAGDDTGSISAPSIDRRSEGTVLTVRELVDLGHSVWKSAPVYEAWETITGEIAPNTLTLNAEIADGLQRFAIDVFTVSVQPGEPVQLSLLQDEHMIMALSPGEPGGLFSNDWDDHRSVTLQSLSDAEPTEFGVVVLYRYGEAQSTRPYVVQQTGSGPG